MVYKQNSFDYLICNSEGNLCKSCAFMGKSKKLSVGDIPITSNILNLGPSLRYMILAFYRPENHSHSGKKMFLQNSKNYIPLERKLKMEQTLIKHHYLKMDSRQSTAYQRKKDARG